MTKSTVSRASRLVLSSLMAAGLALAGLVPTSSSVAEGQRRSRRPVLNRRSPQRTVYAQGYDKGYSDGYSQGGLDFGQRAPRDFRRSDAFQQRDRRYDPNLASSPEYREGYDLGFELGYTDGYLGRARNAAVPPNGALLASSRPGSGGETRGGQRDVSRSRVYAPVDVPNDTELRLKLTSPINTKTNRPGDNFTAVVISPSDYEGATVQGHISALNRSGRVSGKTELSIAFDTITLRDGRQGPLGAQLEKIIESETVKKVDEEGRVETGSRTHDSEVRGGVGAAAGAVIGAIAGGGKGALIGAILGGAVGVGTVYVEGNKDLILDPGTEMVIRTARSR